MTEAWRDLLARFPLPLPSVDLEPGSTALLIVDVQNVSVAPEGGVVRLLLEQHRAVADYYVSRIEQCVLPTIARLLAGFRDEGWPVLYTTVGPELPGGADLPPRRRARDSKIARGGGTTTAVRGSCEHSIPTVIAPRPNELVINKTTTSAFSSTGIDQTLRHLGITGLAMVGVATNACVETTARDAADRGYHTALVEDGCGAFDQPSHEAALLSFAQYFGAVLSADDLLARLRSRRVVFTAGQVVR